MKAVIEGLLFISGSEGITIDKIREITNLENKISYNKVFGYFIEVTNSFKDKVPYDYVRKQTLTGAERYITEELKQFEEQILSSHDEALKLEEYIFDNEYEIRVFSSDGDNIDLFVKKEHVKGNINNKLRKISINGNYYYYLDVKSFKTIEEYDEAFLEIVKDIERKK